MFYPQDDHERFLLARLKELGVEVEWNTTLTGFEQDGNHVRAAVTKRGGREYVEARYLCGCDGAHSTVRDVLGTGFPGGSYDQLFYVADVLVSAGKNEDMFINLGEDFLTLLFPVRKDGSQRLLGLVPADKANRKDLTFDDVRKDAEAAVGTHVTEVRWFSTYHVSHRVSDRFRVGRTFLLGDAGHIHSPAGGQGMNTGIGDAVNLSWKLAQVIQERANDALLNTYETERIEFARMLVKTTDSAFTGMVSGGMKGELVRRVLAPVLLTVATRVGFARHAFFRELSQVAIDYDQSALSEGSAGDVEAGNRLPWTGSMEEDNFAPLRSLDWQAHVYGEPEGGLADACRGHGLPLHVLPWSNAAHAAGLKRDATYLMRPDGYVGLASTSATPAKLINYAERFGLKFPPR